MSEQDPTEVTIAGERAVTVGDPAEARDRFGWEDRRFTIDCQSGRVTEGRWAGVPVSALLEAAGCPPETTHLLVTAADGFRVALELEEVDDGLLALEREAIEVSGGDGTGTGDGTPRLLGPRLDSTKAVQHVDSVRPVTVPAGADPVEYASGT